MSELDHQLEVSRRKRLPPEVERLHALGWAMHWLGERSKIPVEKGWSKGPRLSLEGLRQRYRPGLNPGVRLGAASKLETGNFLAVLDVDVKSSDPRHAKEAHDAAIALFPETKRAARLDSGRGNESCHLYCQIKVPVRGEDVKARSTEKVDVLIGGKISQRPAWEVSLLSEGRQAAAVGAIHPDTGGVYKWKRPVKSIADIPLLKNPKSRTATFTAEAISTEGAKPTRQLEIETSARASDLGLRKEQVLAIIKGVGVTDRSAEVYGLCMAMLQRGTPEPKILGVFTNEKYYLGKVGYDHAHTKNRQRAAQWVEKFCLTKAREKVNDTPFDIEESDDDAEVSTGEGKSSLVLPKGVESVGGWEDKLYIKGASKTSPGFVGSTVGNLLLILAHKCERQDFLYYDEFAQRISYLVDTPWGCRKGEQRSSGTEDAMKVKDWLGVVYGIEPALSMIDEALGIIAIRKKCHPVKEYLESLVWDGKERVDAAFRNYLGAQMPEPYLSTISRHFFQACIQRIYQPGSKFDTVPVLEGKQGIGKSTFGRILAGDEWFMDSLPNVHDKDAALNLVGIWICELGELAAVYRSTNESVKTFITRTCDKVRPPYGQRRIDYPRTTVFIGTTDKNDYLTDSQGNRRWLPVKIRGLDFQALEKDRDQLWAEAMFNFTFDREPLWLTGQAKFQAEALQESRRVEDEGDIMQTKIFHWLEEQEKAKAPTSGFSMHQVFNDALIMPHTRTNINRASEILRQIGFEKRHTQKGNIWERKPSPLTGKG